MLLSPDYPKDWISKQAFTASSTANGNLIGQSRKTVVNMTYRSDSIRREYTRVVEKALGHKLPGGAVVHHWDEDITNNSPENLALFPDNTYHRLIHMRMDAMKACGNPNYRKCMRCG